jgi:hypothetical protein
VEAILHDKLNEAASLRAAVLADHGIDPLRLAHLSREHRRLAQATWQLQPDDLRRYKAVRQQIEQEEPPLRRALAALFAGPLGSVRLTGVGDLSEGQQAALREAGAWLPTVTGMSISLHVACPPGRMREAYDPAACSLLLSAAGTPASVIVHEFGHALEHQAASARQIALRQAFFAKRTARAAPVPLVAVTGNPAYHPTEHTITDKWLHPYIGKLYVDGRASEVVSMGLQLLFSDPVLLADDLEYLDFLHLFLRGAHE